MRLAISVALGAGLACGAAMGSGFGARARAGEAAATPIQPATQNAASATSPSEQPRAVASGESEDDGDSTELDAVVETAAVASLAANTPMDEEQAARHLMQAWHAVLDVRPSEQTLAVLWAHWAHETARGRRMHAFNFAGIKGRGPSGASVVVWTREGAGSSELVRRTFRAYRTANEGARDYVRLLSTRYPAALRAAGDGNAYGFVSALDAGGYFTGDTRAYLRAVTSLSSECRRRGLSRVEALQRVAPATASR
ncbi:MAG TPA: glucosaminidase domain-containing protein [Polyangiaceae bacterium]|jgi:flagellum-specific peptidoglycan hydrolase FlgJ|nr:glucosaminidase domain-containing protein [Polyangiaceae bacterium]